MTTLRALPTITTTSMDSPIGELTLTAIDGVLSGVYMNDHRHAPELPPAGSKRDEEGFEEILAQLEAYFAGTLTEFDLPLTMIGATDFQQRVWSALRDIPYGDTISYGELALRVGSPKASRAVGLANGRNPISIVVPCHRVIGASGSLTGYGGGLERKLWLLEHEVAHRTITPLNPLYKPRQPQSATLFGG